MGCPLLGYGLLGVLGVALLVLASRDWLSGRER
jgi:hypothetical protein